VTPFNPQTQLYLKGIESNMMVHGADPTTAMHRAYGTIWGMVQQQASMQAFVDTFLFMSVIFLLVLPLLFIMKRPKHSSGPAAMH
jgi:DHA2 family multidrug resistance protein